MNNAKKKLRSIFIITVIVFLAPIIFWGIPNFYSMDSKEVSVQDMTRLALNDIFGLDLSQYNVSVSTYVNQFDGYNGSKVQDLFFELQSSQGIMSGSLRFVNETLWGANLSPNKISTAHYINQLPSDPLEASKILMQRLEKYYSGSSYFKPMLDSLSPIKSLDSVNATIGGMKRQAVVQTQFIQVNQTLNYTSTSTSISFLYTFGEALGSSKSVNLRFTDGVFKGFDNGWQLFKIASQNLAISREQAINVAMEQAHNASSNGLKLRNESIRADLTLVPKEPFELHPFWFVDLPLASPQSPPLDSNHPYVHTFTEWQVGIWADTGKIEYSHPA